ncbi:MAG: hypothetical protein QXL79_03570 [Sulfolobales archaeon]
MSVSSVSKKVKGILKEVARSVVELDYPANYRERSIDYVAIIKTRTKDKAYQLYSTGGVVVRVSPGRSSTISNEVEEDLAKFADAIDGVPIVIDSELYDNVVFDYGKVFAANERTLENIVKERELITLYRRNELYVALNIKLIEREVSRGGLRLSEISEVLGLSKKSVESCLKGPGLVSIEKAEKLVSEYSPDMILSIGYDILREIFKKKNPPPQGLNRETRPETLVYDLKKTAVDLVVRELPPEGPHALKFYVDFNKTQSVKHVKTKVVNALRLARELNANLEVIVPDHTSLELVRREVESEIGEGLSSYIKFSSQNQVRIFRRN